MRLSFRAVVLGLVLTVAGYEIWRALLSPQPLAGPATDTPRSPEQPLGVPAAVPAKAAKIRVSPPNFATGGGPVLCFKGHLVPTMLVLGCMKCGTSMLHNELLQHSNGTVIQGKPRDTRKWTAKEQHFFDKNFTSLGRYAGSYPSCSDKPVGIKITGIDSSPSYIRVEFAPWRLVEEYGLHNVNTHVVLVVSLRDPVSRLYSVFHHVRFGKMCNCSFHDWSMGQLELDRRLGSRLLWPGGESLGFHLQSGLYNLQLRHWLSYGIAPERFVVVPMRQYIKGSSEERTQVHQAIQQLAGVRPVTPPSVELFGSGKEASSGEAPAKVNSRSEGSMEERTRQALEQWYHSHNLDLYHVVQERRIRVLPASAALVPFLQSRPITER